MPRIEPSATRSRTSTKSKVETGSTESSLVLSEAENLKYLVREGETYTRGVGIVNVLCQQREERNIVITVCWTNETEEDQYGLVSHTTDQTETSLDKRSCILSGRLTNTEKMEVRATDISLQCKQDPS